MNHVDGLVQLADVCVDLLSQLLVLNVNKLLEVCLELIQALVDAEFVLLTHFLHDQSNLSLKAGICIIII